MTMARLALVCLTLACLALAWAAGQEGKAASPAFEAVEASSEDGRAGPVLLFHPWSTRSHRIQQV